MHTCMYACVRRHMYVTTCVFKCTLTCPMCMCTCMCMCMHMCCYMSLHIYICVVHVYTYMYLYLQHMCVCISIYRCICIAVHMYVPCKALRNPWKASEGSWIWLKGPTVFWQRGLWRATDESRFAMHMETTTQQQKHISRQQRIHIRGHLVLPSALKAGTTLPSKAPATASTDLVPQVALTRQPHTMAMHADAINKTEVAAHLRRQVNRPSGANVPAIL